MADGVSVGYVAAAAAALASVVLGVGGAVLVFGRAEGRRDEKLEGVEGSIVVAHGRIDKTNARVKDLEECVEEVKDAGQQTRQDVAVLGQKLDNVTEVVKDTQSMLRAWIDGRK